MEAKPKAFYTAEGIVKDSVSEEPIEGAIVSSSIDSVETDEYGHFVVRLPTLNRRKTVTITADGYDEYTKTIGRRRLHNNLGTIMLEYNPQ